MQKPRHWTASIQPQFVPLILSGAKRQTVRAWASVPRPGDGLTLTCWYGAPFRSPKKRLAFATIRAVHGIEIRKHAFTLTAEDGRHVGTPADVFARADGFDNWSQLLAYLKLKDGETFTGFVLYW